MAESRSTLLGVSAVRLVESGGFTLTEMLVVMAILGVIVAGLTQLFLSGSKAEADMSNRFRAQQNARLALDGLRREIHCASDVTVSGTPPWTSIKITLGSTARPPAELRP